MKNSTTRKATPKKVAPPDSLATLAEALSVVMNHPLLPMCYYNYLVDAVSDIAQPALNEIEFTPEIIERGLELYMNRKGGAR